MNSYTEGEDALPIGSNDNLTIEVRDLAKLPQLELRTKLAELRHAHGDVGAEIEDLRERQNSDVLHIQRLKKRKLLLKDKITAAENLLLPDIIA